MNWIEIKGLISASLSNYSAKRTVLLRSGKYNDGDHYTDGYVSMIYETLQDLKSDNLFYPLDVDKTRKLIYTFNRLTGEKVPDVWKN